MATADHVMPAGTTGCVDVASGSSLTVYKSDPAHDLALVTGPRLPTGMPYVKVSCQPFKTGEVYHSYGISNFKQKYSIIRNNRIIATANYTGKDFKFGDGSIVAGARIFDGFQAPGMSGGPVVNSYGYAHGLVTGGSGYGGIHFEFKDSFLCKK
jgi:hypothetical protein